MVYSVLMGNAGFISSAEGLGFRARLASSVPAGLGFRVQGLGFRVQGLGFRV